MGQSITTTALTPGLVLAVDVRASNGRLLLPAGTCLADKQLTILRTWGVSEVQVEGATPPPVAPAQDEERFQQALAALIPRFCHTDLDQPAMAELLRLGALRRARRP